MADDTPPPELVQARRDFVAADAELAALAAGAPSAIAQDGRVVGVDPELAARMAAVHAGARIARFRGPHLEAAARPTFS
jgi:hypothetical protein